MLGIHLGSHGVVAERLVMGIRVAQRIKRVAELGNRDALLQSYPRHVDRHARHVGGPGIGWADGDVIEGDE